MSTSHDIIDGQQRLTTILEFNKRPSLYFTEWARVGPKSAGTAEPEKVRQARLEFDLLCRALRPRSANYLPPRTPSKVLKAKAADDAERYLSGESSGTPVPDRRFIRFVDSLIKLRKAVDSKKVIVEELTNLGTSEAEQIYHLVNTSGTQLVWWQLLWSNADYVGQSYASNKGYQTRRDDVTRHLVNVYRKGGTLRKFVGTNDSFWHAMLALGEYVQLRLAIRDPSRSTTALPRSAWRLGVDGLGFRLVSTLLSHDIGRASINTLFEKYDRDQIRMAIDTLFDTADLLLARPASTVPDFLLFEKLAQIDIDAIPAYPLIAIFTSAAKLVGLNKASNRGITLTNADRRSLRALTEELFRQVICTSEWAGTGDARLKEWLGKHFDKAPTGVPPSFAAGAVKSVTPSYRERTWLDLLGRLQPLNQRQPDRQTAALLFWVQYLFDSKLSGCLPKGPVQMDHIVPYHQSPNSPTSHPLNLALVPARLNREKSVMTYSRWNPSGGEDAEYRKCVLAGLPIAGAPSAASFDFLPLADHAGVRRMLDRRRRIMAYGLGPVLRDWISNGD